MTEGFCYRQKYYADGLRAPVVLQICQRAQRNRDGAAKPVVADGDTVTVVAVVVHVLDVVAVLYC